jgi:hypothetical protein
MRIASSSRFIVRGGLVALVGAVLMAGCESPTDPSDDNGSADCATFTSISQAVQTFDDGQVVSTSSNCAFNATAIEMACQLTFTDSVGGPGTGTQTTRWASRGDIVDQVAINPPRTFALGTTTVLIQMGVPFTTTSTNSYDAQRRLTGTVVVAPFTTITTTYTTWDSFGRPTNGSSTAAGSETITYDNANRTVTRVSGPNTCTQTHDENGFIIREVCTGTSPSTTVATSQATLQVCR